MYVYCPKTDSRINIAACKERCKPKKYARHDYKRCEIYRKTEMMTNRGHFSNKMGEYVDEINKFGAKIEAMGHREVWRIIQQFANQEIHPGAIAETLRESFQYLANAKKVEAYLKGVMKTKKQNYREKDFLKEHENSKAFYADLVDRLKRV